MRSALLLTGGVGHPFAETSEILVDLLASVAIRTTIVDDPVEVFDRLATDAVDLFVVNALRWRMLPDRYAHQRAEWAVETPPRAPDAMAGHLDRGGGVLAMHTACICFDDWPGWGDLLGGAWNWEESSHPPAAMVEVTVHADADPIVAGLGDFEVHDEVYQCLRHREPVVALATSVQGGAVHPLVWTTEHAGRLPARVVVDTLGHSERSFDAAEHREIVRRAARWAAGEDPA